jgi:hypothetical protein
MGLVFSTAKVSGERSDGVAAREISTLQLGDQLVPLGMPVARRTMLMYAQP